MSREFCGGVGTLACVALACVALAPVSIRAGDPHVRALSPRVASAMRLLDRSRTFGTLTARLESSDLIVHVAEVEGGCGAGLKSCTTLIAERGGFRYVRIQVAAMQPYAALLAQIAHEMQHAAELIGRPEIRTNAAICNGLGWHSHQGRCETRAAQDVARRVMAEVAALR